MTRALPAGLVIASLVSLGAAVVAQQPAPQNEAGKPTLAKVLVLNHERTESIPVSIIQLPNDLPVRVATAGTMSVAVSGVAAVEARTARQQWEYRSITFSGGQDVTAQLNALGQDGWEVVGTPAPGGTSQSALLKRPR